MNFLKNLFKIYYPFTPISLISCGDSGGQLSKGHRDAIKIQCENSSDLKLVVLRKNF